MTVQMIKNVKICNDFNNFENKSNGVHVVDDWRKTFDFQRSDGCFPFTDAKTLTIYIWEASGYYPFRDKKYHNMFAYTEVIDPSNGKVWSESFFGESSGMEAYQWAMHRADEEIY